ncbi:transcriptional regulator [Aliidiomarina shirensis]|uniref:Transcriptional regulator n=1 Tax=Aliidiomarina shirensis TaxID=1048642 RepID=A0A432WXH1_9GAMM|nr:ChrR family anti-sigma-E factor [Aliidiomarina shirensis]RUO38441.1 transcriptional regulator [Aliidiomarina shirensis]
MIKFHPTEELLVKYTQGELDASLCLVIGTHIDMCPVCANTVKDIEEQVAKRALNSGSRFANTDIDNMLEQIMNSSAPEAMLREPALKEVMLEGKQFKVPPSLGRLGSRLGPWSKVPGSVWRAPVDIEGQHNVNLIYMAAGASVPEHTHRGSEATLVLNGSFADEFDNYGDGDFIYLGDSHRHSPQTAQEDCLTLAWLDAPLQFTSGIARLLNPFSSLFFR